MQRKTDEASVLHKRLHHLALESDSGREKAQAYASGLTPGVHKPRTPGTPGGYRTPSKGKRGNGPDTPSRQGGTPAGVTPRVSVTGGRSHQRHLADVQVMNDSFCAHANFDGQTSSVFALPRLVLAMFHFNCQFEHKVMIREAFLTETLVL